MNPREAYRDLADDARDYGDPDRAIDTAGRRRAASLERRGRRGRGDRPVHVVTPAAGAGARPGQAAARERAGPLPLLRLSYRLFDHAAADRRPRHRDRDRHDPTRPATTPSPRTAAGSASPTDGGYLLSDLLGGPDIRLPAELGGVYGPWVWAADSSRIILANHRDGEVFHYLDVDLRTGGVTRPEVPEGNEIVGLTAGGDLILQHAPEGHRRAHPDRRRAAGGPPRRDRPVHRRGPRTVGPVPGRPALPP